MGAGSTAAAWRLPEVAVGWVTDAGLETDLIFHRGIDLPDFAAFPLVEDEHGRRELDNYYRGFVDVAARARAGLMLETPTWRASPDWGTRLGYDAEALHRVNRRAVEDLRDLADEVRDTVAAAVVGGSVGPRGDAYRAAEMEADEAADYHRPQLAAFADAGADLATAYTLTTVAEAVGIVRAAADVALPVAIAFTVETDGRLPDGTLLGAAVTELDEATGSAAAHLLVNCAHPDHVAAGLDGDASWTGRVAGLRVNSSRLSHAELDDAEELDEGDLADLAAITRGLAARLPSIRIIGGCCGTDVRHVAAMWADGSPVAAGRTGTQ
ncbi:homocysteine methyltransferase [Nocardioides sp. Root122]|uniref:homocysteine S-methyltransferase family protein n=1 Tax=Nocardioides TaxID=1839 RepID=UPI0007034912|nr:MULTISPECIES: homocysteine S-methyltransferase family protein [Nocardioides]KQV77294.1 homocysteine methyltransferase [Nocardioides sp. Root122]MCK9825492.1 homocysteine S-methyltransferase family protein [Nocardioides cavernae]